MGSTRQPDRYDNAPLTLKPIETMVRNGQFKQALAHPSLPGARGVDAAVLEAICDYRLGNASALERLYTEHPEELSQDHYRIVFRHEVLGHICARPRRWDEAIRSLLPTAEQGSDVHRLEDVLRVLREGQRSAQPKKDPNNDKPTLVPPIAVRMKYLSEASEICQAVSDNNAPADGEAPSLVRIISSYMLLLIELRMVSYRRSNPAIKRLHRELSAVDQGVKASLPSRHIFRFVQYQVDF